MLTWWLISSHWIIGERLVVSSKWLVGKYRWQKDNSEFRIKAPLATTERREGPAYY